MELNDDDGVLATQPVRSLLLNDIVAYVEVRSGHDNRSRGVKAELRKLGARVVDTLTKDVTHVIFNEGLPSTYKKAKKLKCHLVSVLWIEACKEELTKVSEAGFPPIGQQLYEDPTCLKNFKKLKSMQPDFDEEVAIMKTNQIQKRIQRRKPKLPQPLEDHDNRGDFNKPSSSTSQTKTKKLATKRNNKKPASPKRHVALKEITPVVINKSPSQRKQQAQIGTSTAENIPAIVKILPESLQKEESSESVIFCAEVEVESSSNTAKRKKKRSKISSDRDISRAEFVAGLSTVVQSMSENNEEWMSSEISPWRKRLHNADKKTLPRNSKPSKNDSASKTSMPRRSSRQSTVQSKLGGQSGHGSVSASAVILQKQRVQLPLPKSPGEDFMLLSQEPGDMPSIDELARMRKGSVNVGALPVSFSQIVRSYNAVAQRNSDRPVQPEVDDGSVRGSGSEEHNGHIVLVEDAICDEEVVQTCQNTCPSEAESTVSSTSTRVLINGMVPERSVNSPLNILPDSEEVDHDELSSFVRPPEPSATERNPSPIFVIKKAKLRRPMKKTVTIDKKDGSPPTSSDLQNISKNENSLQDKKPESEAKDNSTTDKAVQSKGSINPMDYINKIFLPRFLSNATTPHNNQSSTVYVEETPDSVLDVNNGPNAAVIPPTPAADVECDKNNSIVSPTQSLTSSVFSWVKRSCKVPLFSSRQKQSETPNSRQTNLGTLQVSSEKAINKNILTKSGKHSTFLDIVEENQESVLAAQSKESEDAEVCSNTKNPVRKSVRQRQILPSSTSLWPPKNIETQGNMSGSSSTAERINKPSGVTKPQTRARVICVVELNDDSPNVESKKLKEEASSGYDTSNSEVSISKKSPKLTKSSDTSSFKRKRISEAASPSDEPVKKRSEVYETSTAPSSPTVEETHERDSSSNKSGKKRTKTTPNVKVKRAKVKLEPLTPTKSTRQSRADSSVNLLGTRSHSDVSEASSKSLGRKSSEVAKKRLARSLTRANTSNTPKVIVCTFLTASEQNGIDIAGESLCGWRLENKVTSRTTHVINSGPKRTLNMLKGMVRGCWLVDQKWMLDSAKAGEWLDEEKYELSKFSPAVRQCRLKRQAVGKEFKHDLFSKVGAIYVSPKTENPPAKDVRELLELCGAELTTSQKDASIIIGVNCGSKSSSHCVNARWVLDSVTKNKILSVSDPPFQIE
ncbi:Microcephalin [Frankliniella fusca]|uniref:Microcephalin n=1 Tax=Frankliniella fusca TaxID=407009 RepID=A0AAE1LSU8_9NEOP|nr:Microcephalin [Frankliniella fusca]